MASALDDTLDAIMDKITAPGAMFETMPFERNGAPMPVLRNAPPSLSHYFAHFCAEHANRQFLVDGETRLSFAETFAAARMVAHGLIARHGVGKGDRVGLAARNSASWIVAYMGIVMAGGCATLLNGFWTGGEMAYGIRLAGCRLVLADGEQAARLNGEDHGAAIAHIGHGPPQQALAALSTESGTENALPALAPDDLATLLFTSGSTGYPKGAFSDHRGVVHGALSYAAQTLMAFAYLDAKGEAPTIQPAALVAVPLFHVTGEVPLFLQSFALGRKLVMMPRWDPLEALRLMEEEKVTYFVGVPLMSYEIATHPDRARFDLSACSAFAAGGAPRPAGHVALVRESFPLGFPLIGYGLTETNAIGCANLNENYLAKPESTGRPSRPLVDLAILDDQGQALPQGQMGEVGIRTVANVLGYWNDPEATASAFTSDGYFLTGDLGYLDEDGYLFIVDRKKDIIIRGGENISCIEVEQAIYAHPDVTECAVFALPDERLGEVPAAVFLPRQGSALSRDDLASFLAARLASFKVPAQMWQAETPLPRLGTQKIDKRAVRQAYAGKTEQP